MANSTVKPSKQKYLLVAVLILAVTAGFFGIVFAILTRPTSETTTPRSSNPQDTTEQTYVGTYECLPHKDTQGPITLECAFGLQTADGKHYALDMNAVSSNTVAAINTGERIEVRALFTPLEALSSRSMEKYDIVGVLSVTSVKKI